MEVSESEPDNFKAPLVGSKAVHSVVGSLKKTQPEKVPRKCDQNVPLPYEEPAWAATPPENWHFEVLKSGVIISNYTIGQSRVVIGRLTTCDIALEHPSVSRYHAILQYCGGAGGHAKGFYIYDLGSTHGTFLNKKQIEAKTYYLVKNGHVLRFGGSTRLHILTGEDSDDEVDSEIKLPDKPVAMTTDENEVCDWGIGEDAEDEDDVSENPFALSTENEQLYIDDPKKTLRGWFEREGYELEYNVEEKGFRTFVCTVRLPIDTPTGDYLNVEASVNGKKKEAVVACALEACRTLDRHGLLRQSHHGSRERKRKNWEDEDFYDSDEDVYLDRTGTIEKKRQIRMKLSKKSEPETFGTLSKKLDELNVKISEIERKLQVEASNSLSINLNDDPLDSFMSDINRETVDKVTKSKLRLDLTELLKERTRLEKLLNIVKPADLPVKKFPGMIGKKSKSKLKLPVPQSSIKKSHEGEHLEVEEEAEEEIEEEEIKNELANAKKGIMNSEPPSNVSTELRKPDEGIKPVSTVALEPCKPDNSISISSSVSLGPSTSDSAISLAKEKIYYEAKSSTTFQKTVDDEHSSSNVHDLQKTEISSTSGPPSKNRVRKGKSHKASKTDDVYNEVDENYSMWMPPVNQSGDGTTHLNSRYGY